MNANNFFEDNGCRREAVVKDVKVIFELTWLLNSIIKTIGN